MKAGVLLPAAFLGLALCTSLPQPASATDALSFPDGIVTNFTGYLNGAGVGWSFVPRNNVTLTEVGYLRLDGEWVWEDAVVCVWAGTNGPIATFTDLMVAPTTAEPEMLFAPVTPLQLLADTEYRITLHRGSWPDQQTVSLLQAFQLGDCGAERFCRRFIPAPALQFLGNYIFTGNVFTPQPDAVRNGSFVYVGPSFRFEPAGSQQPRLQFLRDGTRFVLSWPAASGFCVEAAEDLRSASWLEVTNGVAVAGDSLVLTNSMSGSSRFFRLRTKIW